ncbi:hypothetical protein GCM10022222_40310 [Amycolatopsis ultiminotia]|uniref:HTH gntR-type domain-containing protein n=1 Tax=Amycolatopsis ultiminotia TaxID=543629 RepID=A0ABP6WJJ3_9PSEU
MDAFDPDNPRAAYQLVADAIESRVADGTYPVGAKLPPHQEIADEFEVSVGTVKTAYKRLQNAKVIITRQGMGTFVRQPTGESSESRPARNLDEAFALIEELRVRLSAVEHQLRKHD